MTCFITNQDELKLIVSLKLAWDSTKRVNLKKPSPTRSELFSITSFKH